jgi:hypothetical protein
LTASILPADCFRTDQSFGQVQSAALVFWTKHHGGSRARLEIAISIFETMELRPGDTRECVYSKSAHHTLSFVAPPEADGIAAMFSLVSSDAEAEADRWRNFALAQARRIAAQLRNGFLP